MEQGISQEDRGIMGGESKIIAIDTEWAKGKPWCLSLSDTPGSSLVVMAGDEYPLKMVKGICARSDVLTLLHNALYDLPVLAQMGIHPYKIADSMIMAYLLQTEPQGLKQLAYRHLGMEMNSYPEMVGPATRKKVIEYLQVASCLEWPKPPLVLEYRKGVPHVRQPQPIGKRINRILSDVQKSDDTDPYARWRQLGDTDEVERVLGVLHEADLSDIPYESAVRYAARDADATLRIYNVLWPRIVEMGLEDTFWRDMRAVPMVVDMMANGMPVDVREFEKLSGYFQQRMDLIQRKIQILVGKHLDDQVVNPASHDQMGELIYDKLMLHEKGGRHKSRKGAVKKSTANEILKRYVHLNPVIQDIIDWREYAKLKGTYSDAIPKLASLDGRIRTTLRITRTATGRLSSSKPNLMAQPTRSEEGRKVRDCYVCQPGRVFVSVDYSQVEMRVAANDSKDERMLNIFWRGEDIHAKTASAMFGLPEDSLDEMRHRYPAKRVGFGILYLITAEGLQRELAVATGDPQWTVDKCKHMIEAWFDIYPGVAAYMKSVGEYAKRYGYVRDMWGRIRFIPGIRSTNSWVRMEAERQAGNAPIQMGAQGVIKEAMGRLVPVYREINKEIGYCQPLIQIHDDIVWEMEEWMVPIVQPRIKQVMEGVAPADFIIPLKVDAKVGSKWGSLEKWK